MKSNGVKLSVCLIIKDEERVLGRVLSAAVQFADELIVVDTGSKDKSIEIAREYTDYVFSEPWQNSFARARNFAASKHGAISCLADTHHRCRVRGAGSDLRIRREFPEERAQKFNSVRCDSLRMSGVKLSGQEGNPSVPGVRTGDSFPAFTFVNESGCPNAYRSRAD